MKAAAPIPSLEEIDAAFTAEWQAKLDAEAREAAEDKAASQAMAARDAAEAERLTLVPPVEALPDYRKALELNGGVSRKGRGYLEHHRQMLALGVTAPLRIDALGETGHGQLFPEWDRWQLSVERANALMPKRSVRVRRAYARHLCFGDALPWADPDTAITAWDTLEQQREDAAALARSSRPAGKGRR